MLSLLFFLGLWVMKPPRTPHHEEPRGQGRHPDDAHPDPYSNADLVTGAEGPVTSCWRSSGCHGRALGTACLLGEDPAVDMDCVNACGGVECERSGFPLRTVAGGVVRDGGPWADNAVALAGLPPRGPGCKCIFPERVKCQPTRGKKFQRNLL